MVVLDTNFLIDLDSNRPAAIEKAREIERAGRPRRVPRIVITELWIAVGKGTETEQNRQKFEQLLAGLPQVDLTAPIAKRAGEIEGQTQLSDGNGVGVGMADAIIAATAIELDEPVVTDDSTDFVTRMQEEAGVSELQTERYALE
ncbi:PIN domain-containing protein [Halobellus ordinarius]|uniref:PIN domain-containing protein n=1 Tax=Halobellus ordinarius TaxID=3075120 RepID=UPI002880BC34|nr:PIN domain-containing protein [Halobellus sp. ZY16]